MNLGRIPAKTALLDPERGALIDIPNDRRMTFGALDERVRRLANAFCDELKLNKGDRIAILSKNCICLLYTSPSPRDRLLSRMPSSA